MGEYEGNLGGGEKDYEYSTPNMSREPSIAQPTRHHGNHDRRGCSYKTFMNYKPPIFNGEIDPILSSTWIMEIEGTFDTSKCADEDKSAVDAVEGREREKNRQGEDRALGKRKWDGTNNDSKKGKTLGQERKRKAPASEGPDSKTESDVRIEENQPVRNEEEETVCNEDPTMNQEPLVHIEKETMNPLVNQTVSNSVPSPPPSPNTTSTPITIVPCPPPITSSRPTTIPISTPILTDSTITPLSSTNPEVTVNISDTGLQLQYSLPIFLHPSLPFLKVIHEKLDQLLLVSKASSYDAYSKATFKSLFERKMKEHDVNAAKMNVAVSEFVDVCKSTTEKFDKLIVETTTFMENYRTTYNNNITSANKAL
ncbi:unnamed protein product [Lactuca saligna]|uniref:Uncharacterized protein n=1 Tax=Lactuca saligna TaxID=75948 RepID=A0AA35YDN9_LACSI|nr:unnamed protein product [Lactuca saligna]